MSECCPDPACSHALYSAVQKETGHLTSQEREIILNVLGRDEMLRREEEQRLMRLKAELQALRRRGALKSGDWSSPPPDPDRTCGRCRVELGRVINRGAYCQSCRLKVCKGCRAYAFRTTDWVCTVCHKRMEIQAVSGEWMNEFVRRPSRRRDNRVYVPAADIIKRTIRRSWTISSPSTRWNSPRGSQPLRPYNSLPRGQDIIKYPSLLPYHHEYSNKRTSPKMQRHTPAQRSHSEDVYAEREVPCHKEVAQLLDDDETRYISTIEILTRPRVNPLAKAAAEGKLTTAVPFEMKTCTPPPEHILNQSNDANEPAEETTNKKVEEKRVSFEEVIVPKKFDKLFSKARSKGKDKSILKPQSLDETVVKKSKLFSRRSLPEEIEKAEISLNEAEVVENTKEEEIVNEQCDIEPFSGTVFRKVTVQRRRQDMRKVPAIDNDESDDIALALKIEDQIEKAYDEQNPISSNVSDPQVTLVTGEQGVEAIGTDAPNTSNDDLKKENETEGETKTEVPNCGQSWRRGPESEILDILLPEGDDYKLVFISSDSSSKEEDVDDNDSSSTASSFLIDDCDWDYFEPSTGTRPFLNWNSPFGSPRVYRRGGLESPLGSPLVYRRAKGSDTGTDEDARLDSDSPSSSDRSRETEDQGDFSRNEPTMDDIAVACVHPPETTEPLPRLCQSCGSPTQYIPIPVPVPIPVPIPALWYPSFVRFGFDTFDQPVRSRLRGFPRSIWPYVNQAALIWPLITTGEANAIFSSAQNSIADECATVTNDSMLLAPKRNETSAVPAPDPVPVDKVEVKNNEVIEYEFASEHGEELYGHLTSENVNMDTDSSERSTDEESGDDTKPRVRRTYNVSGGNLRESDDALPSSEVSSDSEAEDQSSVREDDMSSSGSADTDSNDTGTVADQKPKRFSRVLVVNNSISSSSSCAGSIINESLDSGSDSSDNDTDTEKDCGVVLTNIKLLPDCDFSDSLQNALNGICDNKDSLNECEAAVVGGGKLLSSSEINSIVNDCLSTSPGLSDVSAESHHSSDNEDGITEINGEEMQAQVYNNNNYSAVTEEQQGISTSAGIRSDESQIGVGNGESNRGERTGVPVASELDDALQRHATRYTSLVMITQEPTVTYPQVSVVTSDTTTLIPDNDIVVRHTNWQLKNDIQDSEYKRYLTLTLENSSTHTPAPQQQKSPTQSEENCDVTVVASSDAPVHINNKDHSESVTVITGADTLSALVYLEDGLADDDSWVENLSIDEEDLVCSTQSDESSSSGDEVTLTCTAAIDQDDDHGYQRSAIDFTLHTIVEESCEESEVEQQNTIRKKRPTSATDLEKYFFFGLGDGNISSINSARDDAMSETSSICSEGMDSLGIPEEIVSSDSMDPAELASSRLEKYFLTGFMGFTAERRDSDGSVGSDSEGRPSPEQRRKRLVRARGTGRSHSSSLDNLLAHSELSGTDQGEQVNSEELSSSDTDTNEDGTGFEKSEGQFDTVKRKKNKKPRTIAPGTNSPEETKLESTHEENHSEDDGNKTPQPNLSLIPESRHQQSRDSGFIGSCDDLIKEQRDSAEPALSSPSDSKIELERISEEKKTEDRTTSYPPPPATSLTRKDSFNNWSSDEETNLMMCKMRQFFKTMIANNGPPAKPTTPTLGKDSPKLLQSPRFKNRYKPPQLVYFESELTRLMKSVPGIRDDQVREIVEYLSSEDTWSDSYDSSDYTSSDLEGATCNKSLLQQQISDSCQEIINKFDTGGGESADESCGLNKETAFVYQKLVASLEKMATNDTTGTKIPHTPHSSPPLIAKVMHHIGSRLVALMHEVSSGESHASNSPKTRHYHRRIHPKLSNASSTTTEEDDYITENLMERLENLDDVSNYAYLPRSRSHDLLLSESKNLHQSSSGVSDIAEERETSDYERFSWRGSFESALMATDSRNKLSIIGSEGSASASALAVAAKRRSAGDLMFSNKSLSREQLDRVRSCGSIGGGSNSEDKLWVANTNRPTRRSSVPDAASGSGGSADGEDDDDDDEDEELENRATLPRSLQTSTATTNSLPRLPTTTPATNMYKAHSMYHFLQQNVKSARYRPPGFNKFSSAPKRAVSAPGLQPSHQRRGRRSQQSSIIVPDDAGLSEANSSPMVMAKATNKSGTPSPVSQSSKKELVVKQGEEWTGNNEEDIDRLVAIHTNRSSLSSLGIRSDSMASVYSGAGEGRYGAVTVRGQVEFRLQYNYKAGALEILIIQCKDLAAVDAKRNRSDPYVKVYLLPDKSKSGKRKTKVRKHTLNPVFDECLKFHISITGLETRTLWLTVWHSDMFGRNDFLGEVRMALENKIFDDPTPKWYNLQERTEPFEDVLSFKGDVLVGLKFVPPDMTVVKKGKRSRGTLHVKVKEAKSLTAVKSNGTSDPFCKSYLLPDKGRTSKQKTAVIRKTINAVWNHTFLYDDVTLQELAERCLELTVWDHDRLGSNEFLGGVRFSLGEGKHYGKSVDWMDSTGKEVSLWKSMLERPNFWVEGCLPLRPTLDYRTS